MSYAYNKAKETRRRYWKKHPKRGHGQGYHHPRLTPSEKLRNLLGAFSRGVGSEQGREV